MRLGWVCGLRATHPYAYCPCLAIRPSAPPEPHLPRVAGSTTVLSQDADKEAVAQLHELLSQLSTPHRMLAGNRLFSRGDDADCFYLLEEGAHAASGSG